MALWSENAFAKGSYCCLLIALLLLSLMGFVLFLFVCCCFCFFTRRFRQVRPNFFQTSHDARLLYSIFLFYFTLHSSWPSIKATGAQNKKIGICCFAIFRHSGRILVHCLGLTCWFEELYCCFAFGLVCLSQQRREPFDFIRNALTVAVLRWLSTDVFQTW